MSVPDSVHGSNTNIFHGRGSLADNVVTISPCSSVDFNLNQPPEKDPTTNPEKNIDAVFLKMREQLQNLGGRSVLKLYTMLNLERLLREANENEKKEEEKIEEEKEEKEEKDGEDKNEKTDDPSEKKDTEKPEENVDGNPSSTSIYDDAVEGSNDMVSPLDISRTTNSSFVGVVSSCASSLGIPQSKSTSVTNKMLTNDLLQDQPGTRRGSLLTASKNNADLNTYMKMNERRFSHSRPRTGSLSVETPIYKNNKVIFPSSNTANIQNIESTKSIEVCPINDKEVRNSKVIDDPSSVKTTSLPPPPKNDIYNDNIAVTFDELVDGCTRVGLNLTQTEYDTLFRHTKSKNSMIGIHRFILRIGGGLSVKRLELVQNTFKMLINSDVTTPYNAFILLKDAKAKFSPNEHPRVKSGELTPEQVLYRFLFFFESDRPDGVIELIEWEYYYATISAEISQDSFFEKQMVQCWPGLQIFKKYNTTPKINSKRRREVAVQLNIMNYVTNNFRVFRDLLDIAFIECNQDGMHHLEKNEVYEILRHFYELINQPFDESIFDELWIRIYKELEEVVTISDYEEQLYNAIRKEITYMEYEIFVHVADEEQ